MEINLKLHIDEVNLILQVMGDLPSKTGVFPLMQKIQAQGQEQMPQEESVGD
jgi:hypothetical protein